MFISDRDKGLKAALKTVFPNNLEVSCAKHIEANVAQKFGQKCSRMVCAIAKTFSTRRENELFEEIRKIKPAAARYLMEDMNEDVMWRGTSWLCEERPLPPRYGIVTSNTSESVNSMFAAAREVGWLEAVEKIVDIISTKIYRCQQKYKDCDADGVVPAIAQVLKKRWDKAASLEVIELEEGLGQFKVVDGSVTRDDHDNVVAGDQQGNILGVPLMNYQQSIHILKPHCKWCSCGLWQEHQYPCRHACAFFRKWLDRDLNDILQNEVHGFYSYNFLQKLYTRNVIPVVLDSILYDGSTKPPLVFHKTSGRPRSKRIRRRSEFIDNEESPVTCSVCHQRGHNRRTCRNKEEGNRSPIVAPAP